MMKETGGKSFLETLQALDEGTKKKIMIIATIVIMAIVIYFWLAYFNGLVAAVSQPAIANNQQGTQSAIASNQSSAGGNSWTSWFGNVLRGGQHTIQPGQQQ